MKLTLSQRYASAIAVAVIAIIGIKILLFEPYATVEIENCSDRKLYELILREQNIPVHMVKPTKFEFKGDDVKRIDAANAIYRKRQQIEAATINPMCE